MMSVVRLASRWFSASSKGKLRARQATDGRFAVRAVRFTHRSEHAAAYREAFGNHLPARTVVAVAVLPKKQALMTMNLTAVTKN